MIGIGIKFQDSGGVFDYQTPVVEFAATVQNAMVNLGTRQGSDPIYPDRGTRLWEDAVRGRMVNLAWANHSANFAALHTLAFIQNTEAASNANRLSDLRLLATEVKDQRLVLQVGARSAWGEQVGAVAVV